MVDIGREPGKNRRLQKTITRDRRKDADADAEIKRIGHQRRTGEYVIPTKLTVNTALEQLLPALRWTWSQPRRRTTATPCGRSERSSVSACGCREPCQAAPAENPDMACGLRISRPAERPRSHRHRSRSHALPL